MDKHARQRPEDLGGMGEGSFRMIAKAAGFVVNAAHDDKAGWDFVVEGPSPLTIDYSSQSRPVYRIQVKSTTRDLSSVAMTYSSLVSLIQFGGPAFVLLLHFSEGPAPDGARLLHLDEQCAIEILTTLRTKQVSIKNLKLNKAQHILKLALGLAVKPLAGPALRAALESALGGTYLAYVEAKSQWLQKIEDDSSLWRGSMRLENEDALRAMADCFLGYERPFNVSSRFFFAPMGVPSGDTALPDDFKPTTLKPIEERLPRATISLRTSEYGARYDFRATVYLVPKHLPKQFHAIRLRTALFDIVYRYEANRIELSPANFADRSVKASVKEIRNFAAYMAETVGRSETYLQVQLASDDATLTLPLRGRVSVGLEDHGVIRDILEATFHKLAALGMQDELMTPADLIEHTSRFQLLQHAGSTYEPSLTSDFEATEAAHAPCEAVVFHTPISLERFTVVVFAAFFGSVERLGPTSFRGRFTRSEYLGEVVVPSDKDWQAIARPQSEELQANLRKRGFAVL